MPAYITTMAIMPAKKKQRRLLPDWPAAASLLPKKDDDDDEEKARAQTDLWERALRAVENRMDPPCLSPSWLLAQSLEEEDEAREARDSFRLDDALVEEEVLCNNADIDADVLKPLHAIRAPATAYADYRERCTWDPLFAWRELRAATLLAKQ